MPSHALGEGTRVCQQPKGPGRKAKATIGMPTRRAAKRTCRRRVSRETPWPRVFIEQELDAGIVLALGADEIPRVVSCRRERRVQIHGDGGGTAVLISGADLGDPHGRLG